MKKLLLFFATLLSAGALLAQTNCSDIFISEYVEGWYNNKAMELYNPTNTAITLDNNYRLIRWSNGSTTSDQNPLYVLPLVGTIEPYKVLVMVQDTTKPGQDTMVWLALRKKATWCAPYDYDGTTPGGNVVFWNGDDAVSLQKLQGSTWKDIDIFGEIGVRPLDWQGGTTTVGAWTDTKPYWRGTGAYLTKDQTLIRKHTVKFGVDRITMSHYGDEITGGFPNSFYAFAEYDSMPANYFDSLGSHWCDCKTLQAINEFQQTNKVSIQPNPVTNGQFNVSSSLSITSIEVLTTLGQQVFYRNYPSGLHEVNIILNGTPAGVYLVKIVNNENQHVSRKILIQ
jgi:hypothetical protein